MLPVCLLLLLASTACAQNLPSTSVSPSPLPLPSPTYDYLPPSMKATLLEEIAVVATPVADPPSEEPTAANEAPPLLETEDTAAATAPAPDATNGYEYRTVRRLKYRQRLRRDISELTNAYLPPQQRYLPPASNAAVAKNPPNVYLPPMIATAIRITTTTEVPVTEPPAGLPPSEEQQLEQETEVPMTEQQPLEQETEAPMDEEQQTEDQPQNTALLESNGYHYKQPAEALLPTRPAAQYLPPIEQQQQTEMEVPEESAVLREDGYHYRTTKRFKF